MKKYKIPYDIKKIIIAEGQLPMAIKEELEKNSFNDWVIVERLIPLEELND